MCGLSDANIYDVAAGGVRREDHYPSQQNLGVDFINVHTVYRILITVIEFKIGLKYSFSHLALVPLFDRLLLFHRNARLVN